MSRLVGDCQALLVGWVGATNKYNAEPTVRHEAAHQFTMVVWHTSAQSPFIKPAAHGRDGHPAYFLYRQRQFQRHSLFNVAREGTGNFRSLPELPRDGFV